MGLASLKVGELAGRTGVSVRTLHHYDAIGLLSPSRRTASGHRLYEAADVARLQQIQSLRHLGFALAEIRHCLGRPDFEPRRLIGLHIARLREQVERQRRLCERLEAIAAHLGSAEGVSVEEFLQTIEAMTMIEKYYTPEQLAALQERRQAVGEERIRQVEAEWPVLIAEVRAAMEQGTDPASERVQALARRWLGLVREFTGGDPGIEQSLGNMYQQEATVGGMEVAPMRAIFAYISRAMAASAPPG